MQTSEIPVQRRAGATERRDENGNPAKEVGGVLFWAVIAAASFLLSYADETTGFISILYLFALLQLGRTTRWRMTFPGEGAYVSGNLELGAPGGQPIDRWLGPLACAITGLTMFAFLGSPWLKTAPWRKNQRLACPGTLSRETPVPFMQS